MKKLKCESCLKVWYLDDVELINQKFCPFCGKNINKEMNQDIIENGKCGDNVTWTLLKNGTFIVSGFGDMYNYDLDKHNKKVANMANSEWNKHRDKIKKVEIESGITTIGSCAFLGCKSITNITIPESVTSIGENTFYGCSSLKEIKTHKSGRKNMRNWKKDWKCDCNAKIVYI